MLLAATGLLFPFVAAAQPDVSETFTTTQPAGAFTVTKRVDVYLDGNPTDPFPGDGKNTYVYTLMNDSLSPLPLVGFKVPFAAGSVGAGDAGFIAGSGVAPDSVAVDGPAAPGQVNWTFNAPNILAGQSSEALYIVSDFGPGSGSDTIVSYDGALSFDTSSECLGPAVPPEVTGDPLPCTIGYWKNRADEKPGTLQHFSDAEFDQIVADAVTLSGGLFADSADLLANLGSKGKRTIEERGKQQLAATLMNLAAGDSLPDNQKCKLFDGNLISSNACGDAISVGDAVAQALIDIAGDNDAQHEAHECSDDINNGIGIDD
jgi:hypothetical protein